MKEFFRSYKNDVHKPYITWLCKHWKGMLVLVAIYYGIVYVCCNIEKITILFQKLTKKCSEEEEA